MGSAWGSALDYLERRPRSKKELILYLKQKGYNESEIEEVSQRLEDLGYLDDYKFAYEWVEERLHFKPMGRFRLAKELEKHLIAPEIISAVLDELLGKEREEIIAINLLKDKIIKQNISAQKAAAFLYRRGFAPNVIFNALHELGLKE